MALWCAATISSVTLEMAVASFYLSLISSGRTSLGLLPLSCWRSTVLGTEVLAAAEKYVPLLSVVQGYPRMETDSQGSGTLNWH